MNRSFCTIAILFSIAALSTAQNRPQSEEDISALIRCDDAGMCHAVNMAIKEVVNRNIPVSISIMTPCPWFEEAAGILRNAPHVSLGVHLTLNAEWRGYRWGPVLGAAAVPSLVDSSGYFMPSRALFFSHQPKLDEVERELRAQIGRARTAGLRIDYLDYHMGTAVDTPEMRAIVERLAREYGAAISRYFGEKDIAGFYQAPPAAKTDTLVDRVNAFESGPVRLLVFHVGLETPEMDALTDMNSFGLPEMSKHRNAEREALLSREFQDALARKGVRLVTYRDLITSVGLDRMKRPE